MARVGLAVLAAAAVVVTGCGRFGFDAHDGAPDAAGRECWAAWHAGTITFDTPRRLSELALGTDATGDPSLSADGLSLYVTHDDGTGFDPYVSTRPPGGEWSAAAPIPALDSNQSEFRVAVTADGRTAVVSSNRDGSQGQDLWLATRASTEVAFSPPSQALVELLDTPADEYDPEITADGLRLYFAPQTEPDEQHMAYADRDAPTGAFGPPHELAELTLFAINADPSLSPDQTVIVFAASPVPGDSQMFYATRGDADATFGPPHGVPGLATQGARTSDADVSADGCELYFSSTRDGESDVYVATPLAP